MGKTLNMVTNLMCKYGQIFKNEYRSLSYLSRKFWAFHVGPLNDRFEANKIKFQLKTQTKFQEKLCIKISNVANFLAVSRAPLIGIFDRDVFYFIFLKLSKKKKTSFKMSFVANLSQTFVRSFNGIFEWFLFCFNCNSITKF